MKKFIAMALALVLVAGLSIGGTLAWLSATAKDHNTMVLGEIDIEQLEYQRVVDADGNWVTSSYTGYGYTADLMEEFENDMTIIPAVGTPAWDDRNGSQDASGAGSHQQPWSQIGAPGSNQLFDDSFANVHDKFVFVKNIGKNDCYYRTIIAIECPDGCDSLIGKNFTTNTRFDWDQNKAGKQSGPDDVAYFYATIDGVRYIVFVATYTDILVPGEISRPSLLQVYISGEADNEDVAKYGDKLDVLVLSQAVQAGGWNATADKSAAQVALEAQFGAVTAYNVASFFAD